MASHTHSDFHELILVLHGTLETLIRESVLIGQRGDVLFYPLGEAHAERAIGDEPLETLFLAWQWLPGMGSPANLWPLLVHDRRGRMQMLIQWMRELYPSDQPNNARMLNLLLDAILHEYEQLAQPPAQTLTLQVRTYIQHHLADAITLEQLAGQAGLSKFHFSREFKRLAGLTPMAFLRQERVEAARSLLLSTPLTLQAIASQVGFADEFQLSRVFRRIMGMPPSRLRNG